MRRALFLGLLALVGCDDMIHQPKRAGYQTRTTNASPSPAPLPPAIVDYSSIPMAPPPLSLALLHRGQAQFRQFCTPCHSELGDGNGMVVQRGFVHPPSYMSDKVLNSSTQHYYDVLTNGAGQMYSFAARITPADRWAIAAYIRALQGSAAGTLADVSPEDRTRLEAGR